MFDTVTHDELEIWCHLIDWVLLLWEWCQGAVISPVSLGNSGAPDANLGIGNEAPVRNPVARRALVMPPADGLEKNAPPPEPSPVYVPNARSNGGDFHHQGGRFGSHAYGRGGGYGGGNRRGNGGGGGRRGNEHHGGFDGPRRGGGRRDGHGPVHQHRGHQPTYVRAPPALAVVAGAPPPPPPFVSPTTPQTPPYGAPMGFPGMSCLGMWLIRSWTCLVFLLLCCIDFLVVNIRHSAACLLFSGAAPHRRDSRPAFCASSGKPPGYVC